MEIELFGSGLYINKQMVAQIDSDHLHISLRFLKESGFIGDVVISENRWSQDEQTNHIFPVPFTGSIKGGAMNIDKAIEVIRNSDFLGPTDKETMLNIFKALKDDPAPKVEEQGLYISDLMTAEECKRRYEADPTEIMGAKLSLEKDERCAKLKASEFNYEKINKLIYSGTCGLCLHFEGYSGWTDCPKCLLSGAPICCKEWQSVRDAATPFTFKSACEALAERIKGVIETLERKVEEKFQAGDIAQVIDDYAKYPTIKLRGKFGRVLPRAGFSWVGLEFDCDVKGHDCGGAGKKGYCWRVPEKNLRFIYRKP